MLEDLKRLVKHTAIYGFGTVLSKAVGFVMIPLYTRYLAPTDYGVLELLDLTITVAGIMVGLGISTSIFRFYYQYKKPSDKKEVVSTALIFITIVASAIVTLIIINASALSELVFKSTEFSQYFVWMFVSFLFSTIAAVPESYIMARQRSGVFTAIMIGTLVVNLALNILVVAFFRMGVLGIVYASALTRFLNISVLMMITFPGVGLRLSVPKLKEMLGYGLPLVPASAGQFAINFSDRFFLSQLSSLSSVGLYALGYKFGVMAF